MSGLLFALAAETTADVEIRMKPSPRPLSLLHHAQAFETNNAEPKERANTS